MKGKNIVCLMAIIVTALIVFSGYIEEMASVKALKSTPFTETTSSTPKPVETPKIEEEMDFTKPYDIALSTS